jgi:hypothetical protein
LAGPLLRPRGKLLLYDATGAVAADMESHVAARVAARAGRPYAALRVVCDPAQRTVPRSAVAGMRPDGKVHPVAVLASLMRHPAELPALLALASEARSAMRTLRLSCEALGPDLGWRPI